MALIYVYTQSSKVRKMIYILMCMTVSGI